MRKIFLSILFFIFAFVSSGQNVANDYAIYTKEANSFFEAKDYAKAATYYSLAFKSNERKALPKDRYNAARSWALANQPDSAFFHLYKLARICNYKDLLHITNDTNLICLHNDKRFKPLLELIKENKTTAEEKINKPLAQQLDSIFHEDQNCRFMVDSVEQKYGIDSKEAQNLWQTIRKKDSINFIKVSYIIDKYGWLGSDAVGEQGNSTLFLVIQHADLLAQEKYLPILKEAVKNGKASAVDLALLTDIIEMQNDRPQIYGTQIQKMSGRYVVYPIYDEINVNKRRATVGLGSIKIYLKNYNIDYLLPTK